MTTKGDWFYSWDTENRLIMATNASATVQFSYDMFGRRFQKIIGTTTTQYNLTGLDTLDESTNNTTNKIYTLSGGMIGQIISVRYNNIDYFYHYDALGNVLFISDSNGDIVTAYTQEGFGNVLATLGNLPNPLHLTTKEQDPLTGLYYFGARWYDPQAGRWISKEPLGLDGPNLYQYAFNDPVNGFDPDGLRFLMARIEGGGGTVPTDKQKTKKSNNTDQELEIIFFKTAAGDLIAMVVPPNPMQEARKAVGMGRFIYDQWGEWSGELYRFPAGKYKPSPCFLYKFNKNNPGHIVSAYRFSDYFGPSITRKLGYGVEGAEFIGEVYYSYKEDKLKNKTLGELIGTHKPVTGITQNEQGIEAYKNCRPWWEKIIDWTSFDF